MTRPSPLVVAALGAYAALIGGAALFAVPAGIRMAESFFDFGRELVVILPAAFVLIGLFEVWVPRGAVERHLGTGGARPLQWLWMIVLASTTVGGIYVALPVAAALRGKGARLGLVFSYLALAGVCRIPMTLFEISFLGPAFTVVRYLVSVPLGIVTSEWLGTQLERRGYEMPGPAVAPARAGARQARSRGSEGRR
jgi:uncharacterized membrane protein YraQ (UPF0718 family)